MKKMGEYVPKFSGGPIPVLEGAGKIPSGGKNLLKDAYQYVKETGEKVFGSGEKNVGKESDRANKIDTTDESVTYYRVQGGGPIPVLEGAGKSPSGGKQSLKDDVYQFMKETGERLFGRGADETPKRTYEPSPKHDPKSGWGSPNPIPDAKTGQKLLDTAYSSSKNKQLYNIYDGKLIKFQPDRETGWHPNEVMNPAKEVPADVLRQLLKDEKLTKAEYKRLLKNK